MAERWAALLVVAVVHLCAHVLRVHGELGIGGEIQIGFPGIGGGFFGGSGGQGDDVQPPPPVDDGRRARMPSAREFLLHHNVVRAHLGEQPLRWSHDLARYARRVANHRRGDCALQHSLGPYGENLFTGSGNDWRPVDAVNMWLSEYQFYDPTTNTCWPDKMCGHYTQMVWRDTERLGCARAECDGGGVFIICSYDPPGNWLGEGPFE
ncbi:pathogenesis-related protein 1-like [Nymphaea colorata]|uniref:SCP domain-containing protein n=1 Tax=Nymphaea colorata TaxID=210225 RepID=A0A5K1G5M2_9MAGN|nr:pathogenesis-related protein 1-like [Nymphaea colorata]